MSQERITYNAALEYLLAALTSNAMALANEKAVSELYSLYIHGDGFDWKVSRLLKPEPDFSTSI